MADNKVQEENKQQIPQQQFVRSHIVTQSSPVRFQPFTGVAQSQVLLQGGQTSQVVVQGAPTTQYVGTSQVVGGLRESVKGESRIEYVPYEKTIVEYEAVQRTEYVPKEKKVTDYYAVEYQTEYVPQVYQDRYIEYIPQERVAERVEYQAVERQVVHPPVVEQQVQTVQYVQQPTISYVNVPVTTTQTVQTVGQIPPQVLASSRVVQQQVPLQSSQIVYVNQPQRPIVTTSTTAHQLQGQKGKEKHAQQEERGWVDKLFN